MYYWIVRLDQGLSKHQEVGFTAVTKVQKLTVVFGYLLVQ